jgi:hypothetical protein
LPLEIIALLKMQVLTDTLQVFPAGLLVLRVIVDRHGQEAQLTGEGLEHRGRQPASVAQEVALPTQGAELHGEAELVDHAAANGDLLQVVSVKVKYLRRLSGSRVSGSCSAASKRAALLSCWTGTVVAVGAMGLNSG